MTVNSTGDVIADDGVCTLREAITAANTDTASGAMGGECIAGSGAYPITVPAGSYTLAIPGLGEDFSATGDLDILDDVAIIGAGADVTMLSQPMALAGGASLGCAGRVPLMLCELAEAL